MEISSCARPVLAGNVPFHNNNTIFVSAFLQFMAGNVLFHNDNTVFVSAFLYFMDFNRVIGPSQKFNLRDLGFVEWPLGL